MKRKGSILLCLIVADAILGSTLLGPIQGQVRRDRRATPRKSPPLVHTVIIFLKKDAPANEADAVIADTEKLLAKIPSVREIKAGKPADKATPIAAKDYQVGLLVLFDDTEGLHQYADHPLHKEFVTKHEKSFEKVVVYDFLSASPKTE
jgi:hypothetical protein